MSPDHEDFEALPPEVDEDAFILEDDQCVSPRPPSQDAEVCKHDAPVTCLASAPKAGLVAVAAADGKVLLLDARSVAVVQSFQHGPLEGRSRSRGGRPPKRDAAGVSAAAISRRGDKVVTGAEDGLGRIWSAETGACLHCLEGGTQCGSGIPVSPN